MCKKSLANTFFLKVFHLKKNRRKNTQQTINNKNDFQIEYIKNFQNI